MNITADLERPRASRARVLALGLVLALSVVVYPTSASAEPADDAGVAMSLLNQSRSNQGLNRLLPDRELQILANRQANDMAASGSIYHTANLGGRLSWGWQGWAENVGYGPSVNWIQGAFMNSWTHASNILDPSYNYVGVGVAYGNDGTTYVAQVFGAW